jgi:hypothetical protein
MRFNDRAQRSLENDHVHRLQERIVPGRLATPFKTLVCAAIARVSCFIGRRLLVVMGPYNVLLPRSIYLFSIALNLSTTIDKLDYQ